MTNTPYHRFTKYPHITYTFTYSLFVELPPFERRRSTYLDDDQFCELQIRILENPTAGELIAGTGGLRKLRFQDERRGKCKT